MRIEIEIPKKFECDYNGDRFKDFFSRVLTDIEKGKCLCGNYEIETAEMFIKAFDESKTAYDVEKVVAELEVERKTTYQTYEAYGHKIDLGRLYGLDKAVEIVRKGGAE